MKRLLILFALLCAPALALAQATGPYGVFGGPIPSASLPPAAKVPTNTYAFTTDQGLMYNNGSSWVAAGTGSGTVSPGTSGQVATYSSTGSVVSGTSGPTVTGTYTGNKLDLNLNTQNNTIWSGSGNQPGVNNIFFGFGNYNSGTCTGFCYANYDYINQWNVSAGSNGSGNRQVFTNLGGSGFTGGFLNLYSFLDITATTGNLTNQFYEGGQSTAWASVNDNGVTGTRIGSLYGFSSQSKLLTGATFWLQNIGQETDISMETGASANFSGGQSVVLLPDNASAAANENFGYIVSGASGSTPTIDCAYCLGGWQGGNPLSSGATIMRYSPPGGSGSGPTVSYGLDFGGLGTHSGAITCTNACYTSTGFKVDGSGHILNSTAGGQIYLGADAAGVYNGFCVVPEVTGNGSHLIGCGVDANQYIEILAAGTSPSYYGNVTNGPSVAVQDCGGACVNRLALHGSSAGTIESINNTTGPSTDTNGVGLGIAVTARTATANGAGGPVQIAGGNGFGTSGNGGSISLTAGNGGSTSGNGGNIVLTPGTVTSGAPGAIQTAAGIASTGTAFTVSASSCGTTAPTSVVGGAEAGTFVSANVGACIFTMTINGATGSTAAHGWICTGWDVTSGVPLVPSTVNSTTTCAITGTIAANTNTIAWSVLRGY